MLNMKGKHFEKGKMTKDTNYKSFFSLQMKEKLRHKCLRDVCVCASESGRIVGGIDAEYLDTCSRRRQC